MSTNIKMETENGGQLREDFLKEKRCRRDKKHGMVRKLLNCSEIVNLVNLMSFLWTL